LLFDVVEGDPLVGGFEFMRFMVRSASFVDEDLNLERSTIFSSGFFSSSSGKYIEQLIIIDNTLPHDSK
jgi:hypothetical protein